ncbi:MAG: hypothetical protein QNJ16_06200 [Rhodobacter sp.]|nr:hypothetical protein [Rhodobacter sp.]
MIALITMYELQGLSAQQLGGLHRILLKLLMTTAPHTPDRRNILASLENIERALGVVWRPVPSPCSSLRL